MDIKESIKKLADIVTDSYVTIKYGSEGIEAFLKLKACYEWKNTDNKPVIDELVLFKIRDDLYAVGKFTDRGIMYKCGNVFVKPKIYPIAWKHIN